MTTKVEESIQVDVPVSTAYNQWTQFEDFPHFMGGVKEVHQHDDQRLHWVAEIAGVRRGGGDPLPQQGPAQKKGLAGTEGAANAGAVRFVSTGPMSTTVYLTLEYEPEGLVEQAGDKLGIVGRQAKNDLERFKALIESEGYESGAWRGTVNAGVGVGTPGVEAAAASRGDSGKAGVSPTAVVAGAAAAAAGVAAAVAATRSGSDEEEQPSTEKVRESQPVTVVEQPPPDA